MPDFENSSLITRRRFLKGVGGTFAGSAVLGIGAGEVSGIGYSVQESSFQATDVEIDSFDGTTITATYYNPNVSRPVPAVIMTHGWAGNRTNLEALASAYADRNFAVLAYDSRGFGESGGQVTLNGPNEVKDVSALIDWLAGRSEILKQDQNNPVVGMDGFSYGGGIQMAASAEDNRINAIVPRITWNDLFYSLAPNGVLKSLWVTQLYQGGIARSNGMDPQVRQMLETAVNQRSIPQEASKFLRSRSPVSFIDQIDIPVLLIGGWHDTLFKPNEVIKNYSALKQSKSDVSLIMHNGGHGHNTLYSEKQRKTVNGMVLRWMGSKLLGQEIATPPVSVYISEEESFRNLRTFPPQITREREMNLIDAEDSDEFDAMTFLYNNGFEDEISEVVFDFEIQRDMEVLGTPTLDLGVFGFGTSPQLFLQMYHIGDREQTLIGDQVLPFRIVQDPMRLELPSIQKKFSSGDKLRIRIATTNSRYANVNDFFAAIISDGIPTKLSLPEVVGMER